MLNDHYQPQRADLSRQDDNDSIHQSSWYASKSSNRSRGICLCTCTIPPFWRFQCVMTVWNPHDWWRDDPQIELFTSDWWVSTRICVSVPHYLSSLCPAFAATFCSKDSITTNAEKRWTQKWLEANDYAIHKFPKVLAVKPSLFLANWPRAPFWR